MHGGKVASPQEAALIAEITSVCPEGMGKDAFRALVRTFRSTQTRPGPPSASPQRPPASLARMSSDASTTAAAGATETLGTVFRRLDQNGRGVLDPISLHTALCDLGVAPEVARRATANLAISATPTIDMQQFRQLVKQLKAGLHNAPSPAPCRPGSVRGHGDLGPPALLHGSGTGSARVPQQPRGQR